MNIYGIQRARKAEVSDFVEMIRAKVVLGRVQTVCQTVISRLENFHPDFLYNFEIVSINIRRNRVSFHVGRSIHEKSFRGIGLLRFFFRRFESVSAIKACIKDVVLAREIVIPPPVLATNFTRSPAFHLGNCCICNYTRNTQADARKI